MKLIYTLLNNYLNVSLIHQDGTVTSAVERSDSLICLSKNTDPQANFKISDHILIFSHGKLVNGRHCLFQTSTGHAPKLGNNFNKHERKREEDTLQ